MENKEWLNCQQSSADDVDTNGYQESKTLNGVPNAGVHIGTGIENQSQTQTLPKDYYICKQCGKTYHRRGSNVNKAKYCSLKCKYEGFKGNTYNHHHGIKTGTYFICKHCGKEFYRHNSEIGLVTVDYCSLKCRMEANFNPYVNGDKSPNWRGGKRKQGSYITVHSHNHPFKHKDGYVLEHRLVMEKHLGRYLQPYEDVHHKNGIKTDNRIDNLEIVTHSSHFGKTTCPYCQNTFRVK